MWNWIRIFWEKLFISASASKAFYTAPLEIHSLVSYRVLRMMEVF